MATYYVRTDGNNSNTGLAADSAHAWQTLTKLLGAAGMASGDLAYVAPGVYREAVSVAMTSATGETIIEGDPEAIQFSDITPGEVRWTAYTTSDTAAPAASTTLNLAGRDFLTIKKITIEGGNTAPGCVSGVTTTPTNITFQDCLFTTYSGVVAIRVTPAALAALHWLFDRCTFACFGSGQTTLDFLPVTSASGADWDLDVIVRNCLFVGKNGGNHISVSASAGQTFKPGGVVLLNNTIIGGAVGFVSANTSTSIPCTANNCVLLGTATGLSAGVAGQITSDYNVILGPTQYTNVTGGAHDTAAASLPLANLMEFGSWKDQGRRPRSHFMPAKGSPLIGFGDNGSAPTVDWLNRPRPSGDTSKTVGAIERHDTGLIGATSGESAGPGLVITGPGDHDIRIPVDASSTTISVRVSWDSNHADTNKPRATLLANARIGVSTETQTATGTAGGGFETLTFSAFTPSAKGVVTVRLISLSAADNGTATFDTFA